MAAYKTHCKNGHPRTSENVTKNGECRICQKEWKRLYHQDHKEHINAYTKVWRTNNESYSKEFNIKRKHGITLEEYMRRLERQNYECSICHKVIQLQRGLAQAQLDHDHQSGVLRDFLCLRCNLALGGFEDSILVLESAVNYLKRHKQ